jgi:hypothetical protein
MARNQTQSSEENVEIDKVVRNQGERVVPTRKRKAYGGFGNKKLDVNSQVTGYHLCWINDTPGRLFEAEESGYEYVSPSEIGSGEREDRVKRLVGTNQDGSAMFAFLMKIRQEWYDEDQSSLGEVNRQIEDAIKGGKINKQSNDGRYVPPGGIIIHN